MTQINAYLAFGGNCREAMTFYQAALGGELTLQRVGDSPVADNLPAEARESIMHASLTGGQIVLMASDMLGGADPVVGNTITLSLNCNTEEETRTFFEKLSAGGNVTQPLKLEFWGALFGQFTDKFGIHWMVNWDQGAV